MLSRSVARHECRSAAAQAEWMLAEARRIRGLLVALYGYQPATVEAMSLDRLRCQLALRRVTLVEECRAGLTAAG